MDYLFTPWRFTYLSSVGKTPGCVFCERVKLQDREALIIHRGEHCFIILNAFPYTSGHVMIVPYQHIDELQKLSPAAATEMMALSQRMERTLHAAYKPGGINLGMNIGAAAGAGMAGHIHMHVLPRWIADSNFMTVVGETRLVPEDLGTTWEKLKKQLAISD